MKASKRGKLGSKGTEGVREVKGLVLDINRFYKLTFRTIAWSNVGLPIQSA